MLPLLRLLVRAGRWNGRNVSRIVTQRAVDRMRQAAQAARDYAREKTSTPYPPAGPPGGYPHARSHSFSESIKFRVNRGNQSVRLLSDVVYSRYLEFGTRFMAPRPTFRLVMRVFRDRLMRATGRGSTAAVS